MSNTPSQELAPTLSTDIRAPEPSELTVEELQQLYVDEIAQENAKRRDEWDWPMFVAVLLGSLGLFSLITGYFFLPEGPLRRSIMDSRPKGVTFTTVYYISTWLGIFGFTAAKFSNYRQRKLASIINGLILLPSLLLLLFAFAVATLFELSSI